MRERPVRPCHQVDSYDVTVDEELGEIQLIKIEKRKYWLHDDWYLKYITLKTPHGDYIEFPCYRWIAGEGEIILRDGCAKLARDDHIHILKQHRRKELETRQKQYRWMEWNPGFPLSIDAKCHKDLPRDIQFDSEKGVDFVLNYSKAMENLFINRFMHMFQSSWSDFADFEKIFVKISNTISERVMNHWQEDLMFGYQFLNGCNPVLIRRCTQLPAKLPVTTEMVECSLERQLSLEQEVQQGNIFIVDFELLDGIDANKTDPCTLQFLAAPICLLYKNLANKIVPIAIQLNQTPGDENPIFLPSDAKYDWLLAKIWVRSSDFHVHQTITHLLRTHLVSEVFGIAMYRQLPAVHPIFKLLVAHVRFTIAINTKAREQLICEYGLFDKANATGGGGHVQMVQRAMQDLTYTSLCFPEAIKARGMDSTEDIPYYFYRDDGLLVWEAIKMFTAEVINIYYENDQVVEEDQELQDFVKDVYVYGMRGRKASVRLVLLDPQRTPNHAGPTAHGQGCGDHRADRGHTARPRALLLAPGCSVGTEPVSGKRAVPGHVPRGALHREAGKGGHGAIPQEPRGHRQHDRRAQQEQEAAVLLLVPRPHSQQRGHLSRPALLTPASCSASQARRAPGSSLGLLAARFLPSDRGQQLHALTPGGWFKPKATPSRPIFAKLWCFPVSSSIFRESLTLLEACKQGRDPSHTGRDCIALPSPSSSAAPSSNRRPGPPIEGCPCGRRGCPCSVFSRSGPIPHA
ncbi:arachidonate 5-lipoxygenase isoform X1 [Tupaia chinensis]|uniref:arachidonate 5-lipoxygenase isoform X1 n=1 Tax=Tupaia chinensis TaxID=246437 RepID=UPI000FFC61F3|nr:arachidonate 5-lipoxygenase isoform X1 [Tupaia chinensis]